MKLKKREVYGTVIVDVQGKLLGGPDSETFHRFFKSLVDEGKKRIVVDLRRVPWASSQGVGMLIGAHTSVKNAGGELVLIHVVDRIKSILIVTRLLLIFKTFDNEDEALRYFMEREIVGAKPFVGESQGSRSASGA